MKSAIIGTEKRGLMKNSHIWKKSVYYDSDTVSLHTGILCL